MYKITITRSAEKSLKNLDRQTKNRIVRTCMNTEKDVAIDRVREVRHRISAQFGHDTKRLIDHYIELQKKYADRLEPVTKRDESTTIEVVTK